MKKMLIILLAVCVTVSFGTMADAKKGPHGPKNEQLPLCAPTVVTDPVGEDAACWVFVPNVGGEEGHLMCIEWYWDEEDMPLEEDCDWNSDVDKFSIELWGVIEDCALVSDDPVEWADVETSYDIGTGDDDAIFLIRQGEQDGSYALCIPIAVVYEGLARECDDLDQVEGVSRTPDRVYTEIKGLRKGPEFRNKNNFSESGCALPPFRPVPSPMD